MRKVIINQQLADNTWSRFDASSPVATSDIPAGDVLVNLTTWQANKEALLAHDGRIGLLITGDTEPEAFSEDLDQFSMIAIEFPKFADGRGYSLARILRERFGYKGELRAVGDVLRDQLLYLHRCGFNAFEVREDRCAEDALKAFTEFSVTYQADVHQPRPIYHRRAS